MDHKSSFVASGRTGLSHTMTTTTTPTVSPPPILASPPPMLTIPSADSSADRDQDQQKKEKHRGDQSSWKAKVVGSGTAGILELLLFHPIDTAAKRLMSHQKPILASGKSFASSMGDAQHIIFKGAEGNFVARYLALLPGVSFAAGYKVLQRIYKFGGQPLVKEYLEKRHSKFFHKAFGHNASTMMEATAGSLIGVGEIVLLPLDVLKIKSQTNIEALGKRNMLTIIREEGLGRLYKGSLVTALRNAPGSFALFGGSAFTKEKLLKRHPHDRLSFFEYFICSTVGAFFSIAITNPLDVVKTRIQNKPFNSTASGLGVAADTLRHEGVGAFFKGLTPKLLAVGPKLVFSFAVAQYLIRSFDSFFAIDKKNERS